MPLTNENKNNEQEGKLFGPADPVLTLRPDWTGPPRSGAEPKITDRAGVDLAPPDLKTERLRMLSYIWPDQPDRLARTNAALEAAAKHEPAVTKGDAIDWLENRLKQPPPVYRCPPVPQPQF